MHESKKEEEWEQVAEFPDYSVSSFGTVKNKYGKTMHPTSNGRGYYSICFGKAVKGNNTRRYIHRIVAQAFIENPNAYKEVNHKDSCRHNNHVDNLEWVSRKMNLEHAKLYGNQKPIPRKLTAEMAGVIRKEAELAELPQTAIAAKFGVAQTTVWDIKTKRTWAHLA